MDFDDDKIGRERKRALDFADLQNEMAGRETGRLTRFLTGDSGRKSLSDKEKAKERIIRDMLDMLLQDPAFRALYEDLGNKLRDAETEADTVIADMQAQMKRIERTIENMGSKAARGPDGKPVFRYADGRVVDADNEDLPPEIAAGIVWPKDAPTAEDYFTIRERRDMLGVRLDDWQAYLRFEK